MEASYANVVWTGSAPRPATGTAVYCRCVKPRCDMDESVKRWILKMVYASGAPLAQLRCPWSLLGCAPAPVEITYHYPGSCYNGTTGSIW
jgi:hypothetical protein